MNRIEIARQAVADAVQKHRERRSAQAILSADIHAAMRARFRPSLAQRIRAALRIICGEVA